MNDEQVAMTQKQADALVAQHKEVLIYRGVPVEYDDEMPVSRHSPEGFDQVLSQAEMANDMLLGRFAESKAQANLRVDALSMDATQWEKPWPESVRMSATERARHQASILIAFAEHKPLECRSGQTDWRWVPYEREGVPPVQGLGTEWRVRREPRAVWVRYRDTGQIAAIAATQVNENYIRFEEVI